MATAISQRIQENYAIKAIGDRLQQALDKAGLGTGSLQWSDLTLFGQFHVRGLEATKELAQDLQLKNGQTVLDVGSGWDGPARYLAAVHALHVTGIDLTSDFIEIFHSLSQQAGLTDKLSFKQGDAPALPFPEETFDLVWTQHVAMDIQDKINLYQGFHRVLKRSGQLALYDVIQGNNQPFLYPTPWARDEGSSILATES